MSDRIDHDSIKIDNSAIEEKLFYKVYSGIYRGRNVSVAVKQIFIKSKAHINYCAAFTTQGVQEKRRG